LGVRTSGVSAKRPPRSAIAGRHALEQAVAAEYDVLDLRRAGHA
jgi:hypothetical protein